MSLTNTFASLALGVATESGSSLLENTFDAATSELAQEGRERTHDAGHSLSRHLARNPRHALEQNLPLTRFLPQSPLAAPVQDLALAGIGSTWQMGAVPSTWLGAGDLVQTGSRNNTPAGGWKEKANQHIFDWNHSGPLRFYGEPLLLLTLLGGSGLIGLGLGAVALKTLTRKPPKTNRDSAGTGTESRTGTEAGAGAEAEAETGTEVGTGTEAGSGRSIDELLDGVLAERGIDAFAGGTPPEDRPTEAGGMLDVDPPSRADPPTRVSATIDEVPVDGAPANLGTPPLPGEASGVAGLPFGRAPAPRAEPVEGEFTLPAPDEDGDIEIDLSGLSDSVASDTAVEDNSGADILFAGEEAPDDLEADPAETTVQVGPIIVIEAPFSFKPDVKVGKDGETELPPDPEIADAFFSDAAEGEVAPPPVPRAVLIPTAPPEEEIDSLDDRTEDMDRDPKVARTSGEGTDPGSERQRDQLREEVVADSDERAPVVAPPVELPRTVVPQVVPPTEPAEPVVIRPPVRSAPPPPRIVQRHVTPLPDAPAPLPVAVGPSPDEPRPVRPVPPRPIVSPAPPPPVPVPTPRPAPAPKPAPSLLERGAARVLDVLNGLVSSRVEEAERPADDPLVYKGPVAGVRSDKPLTLRVPFGDQQIKDGDSVNLPLGNYQIDLKSRPLQHFLERAFPYGALSNSPQIIDEITARYHALLTTPNSFTRVADHEANNTSLSLDEMITGGFLRNRNFAAIMMQLSLERVGIYSEVVTGEIAKEGRGWREQITAIAIYPRGSYRGTPTDLIDVTNVRVENPANFKPDSRDWLPRPSKRER